MANRSGNIFLLTHCMIVSSAKEVIRLVLRVCHFVCHSFCHFVSRITANIMSRFRWNSVLWLGLPVERNV